MKHQQNHNQSKSQSYEKIARLYSLNSLFFQKYFVQHIKPQEKKDYYSAFFCQHCHSYGYSAEKIQPPSLRIVFFSQKEKINSKPCEKCHCQIRIALSRVIHIQRIKRQKKC